MRRQIVRIICTFVKASLMLNNILYFMEQCLLQERAYLEE